MLFSYCVVFVLWKKTMTQQLGTWRCEVCVGDREIEIEIWGEVNVWLCACDTVFAPLCNTCTPGIQVPRPGRGQRSLLALVCHWMCMPVCSCMSERMVFCVCRCVCVCVCMYVCVYCRPRLVWAHARWLLCVQPVHQSVSPHSHQRTSSYSLASRKSVSCGNSLASSRVDSGSSWVIWEERKAQQECQ